MNAMMFEILPKD